MATSKGFLMDSLPDEPYDHGITYLTGFRYDPVVLHGRAVPFLQGRPNPGGTVTLTLDRRWDIDLPVEVAEVVTAFVADAIAVALGYACHPRTEEPARRTDPFGPIYRGVDSTSKEG